MQLSKNKNNNFCSRRVSEMQLSKNKNNNFCSQYHRGLPPKQAPLNTRAHGGYRDTRCGTRDGEQRPPAHTHTHTPFLPALADAHTHTAATANQTKRGAAFRSHRPA
jgi:hypothetical protein